MASIKIINSSDSSQISQKHPPIRILKILQINFNHRRAASSEANDFMDENRKLIDLVLLLDAQYSGAGKLTGFSAA